MGASCPPEPLFSHLAISYLSGAQFEASPSDVAMCVDIASRGIDALTVTQNKFGEDGGQPLQMNRDPRPPALHVGMRVVGMAYKNGQTS